MSDTEIAVLESGQDRKVENGITCSIRVAAKQTKQCAAAKGELEEDCFSVTGKRLAMYGASSLDVVELTKISD